MHSFRILPVLMVTVATGFFVCGCNSSDAEGLLKAFQSALNPPGSSDIQSRDPRTLDNLPEGVVPFFDGRWIGDLESDLLFREFNNSVFLAIENKTSYDVYVTCQVDGREQRLYVLRNRIAYVEYGCPASIQMVEEKDFDPGNRTAAGTYDLTELIFSKPNDFKCGEVILVTIADDGVTAGNGTIGG